MRETSIKSVMINISPEQYDWLKVHRAKTGKHTSKIVRVLLDYYIALEENKDNSEEIVQNI